MEQEKEIEKTARTDEPDIVEEETVKETTSPEESKEQPTVEEKASDEQAAPGEELCDGQSDEDENTLIQKIQQLQEQLTAKEDQLLRQRAEFDNYRKRTQREKEELYQMATADCILPFLGILDNLERAAEADGETSELKDGIAMILKQFRELLDRMEVREIAAQGVAFDPNQHNAVNRIEDEKYGENIVCQVFQKGYQRKDKVLRHAMVVVANP